MAVHDLTRSPSPRFPQPVAWPDSILKDQAAIEQARRELGPDADFRQILDRAMAIKAEVERGH